MSESNTKISKPKAEPDIGGSVNASRMQGTYLACTPERKTLAEGLKRIYGTDAAILIQEFANQNAKVGDFISADFWAGIATILADPIGTSNFDNLV